MSHSNLSDIFSTEKNPLVGGIDRNNLITVLAMALNGSAHTTLMAPDVVWFEHIVNANDTTDIPLVVGDGIDVVGYAYAMADVKLQDVSRCVLKPWFWNEALQDWFAGDPEVVFNNKRIRTRTDGCPLYVQVLEMYPCGPDPKISVYVAGTTI